MRFTSIHDIKTVRRQVELEQYAWRNRRAMTESEAVLWAALRDRQLGVQFRRQVQLCARYVVDFCAPAAWLVVEVDGGYHARRGRADARRGRDLARLGYRVLRLPAAIVLNNFGIAHRFASAAKTSARASAVSTTFDHVRLFDRSAVTSRLEQAGFEVVVLAQKMRGSLCLRQGAFF